MPLFPARTRRVALRVTFVGVLAAACAAVPPMRFPEGAPRPVPCPAAAFFGGAVTVTVPQEYSRIDLTHGHSLEFDEGAVPVGSQYRVSRARGEFAALDIQPVGDAPSRFDGLARLTVNYAACGAVDQGPGFGIYRWDAPGVLVPVPSARGKQRVSALLEGFSVYALGTN